MPLVTSLTTAGAVEKRRRFALNTTPAIVPRVAACPAGMAPALLGPLTTVFLSSSTCATDEVLGPAHVPDFDALRSRLGPAFEAALDQNERDHLRDRAASCDEHGYYCGRVEPLAEPPETKALPIGKLLPVDFPAEFEAMGPDLIHVTPPLFSAAECAKVIAMAEHEAGGLGEFPSGKYRMGGDWLTSLPTVKAWFNEALRTKLFPLVGALLPAVVGPDPSELRAHSVIIAK